MARLLRIASELQDRHVVARPLGRRHRATHVILCLAYGSGVTEALPRALWATSALHARRETETCWAVVESRDRVPTPRDLARWNATSTKSNLLSAVLMKSRTRYRTRSSSGDAGC